MHQNIKTEGYGFPHGFRSVGRWLRPSVESQGGQSGTARKRFGDGNQAWPCCQGRWSLPWATPAILVSASSEPPLTTASLLPPRGEGSKKAKQDKLLALYLAGHAPAQLVHHSWAVDERGRRINQVTLDGWLDAAAQRQHGGGARELFDRRKSGRDV